MPTDLQLLNEAARILQARNTLVLCTVVEKKGSGPRDVGAKMLVTGDGKTCGTIGGGNVERALIEASLDAIKEGKSRTVTFSLSQSHREGTVGTGMICGGELTVLANVIEPTPRLIIVGAGHVAEPLTRLASNSGFEVTIIDDETKIATKEKFPTAQTILAGNYNQTLNAFAANPNDAVVVAHGEPEHDYTALKSMIGKNPAYVGLLGSKTKAKLLTERLRREGVTEEQLKVLHAPVGLDIGAETPEEIGVSILAEIISLKRKRVE
jgi:xanthine dehydrogenase accessory factor